MLDSLIYSINTVFPIFIIVILGSLLKKFKFLNSEFFSQSEKLVFKLALPAMLFLEVAGADPSTAFDPKLITFCVCGVVLSFLTLCLIVPLFIKSNDRRGAFIQGVYRSNFAILGVPLIENMFGDSGVAVIAMVMPFAITLFNVFAVIILSIYAPAEKKLSASALLRNIVMNIIKNPLIISVILALPFLLTGWQIPVLANKCLTYLSNLSMPLALLSLGANFSVSELKGRVGYAVTASCLKVIAVPLILVLTAILMGFRNEQLGTIFVLFGGPTAVSSYIMAKNMESDYVLAGQIILITTLMCIATIFLGTFTLSLLNFI